MKRLTEKGEEMAECERLKECPYFEGDLMKEVKEIVRLRQEKYCKDDNMLCARYIVFKALGKENVPADLLPIQVDRAKELIEEKKSGEGEGG
jgi:hypothetical protein